MHDVSNRSIVDGAMKCVGNALFVFVKNVGCSCTISDISVQQLAMNSVIQLTAVRSFSVVT